MKNFTYHSQEEKDTLEAILRRRKRKINHQQIVAAIITVIIMAILALYVTFHVYYSEFDGYVHVDANKVRTPFDIYLDSVYVKEGDVVAPGDTLYSYYNIDELVQSFNINSEPAVIGHYRDLSIQYANLQQQTDVVRARIMELQAQIQIEDHNISYGLSSNSHKLDLERELNVARAQLAALLRQMSVIGGMRDAARPRFVGSIITSGNGNHQKAAQVYDDARSPLLKEARSYHLASDSSIITALQAPDRMVFFREEEIMATQHIDLDANNLKVLAYIPVDKMHRITNNSVADVVINSDFTFKAHVTVLGMRTELIPENLRSYFSKKNTMVIAILEFDKNQYVPFWTMADGLPVDVRIRNLDTFGEKPSAENYLWYKTGAGIQMNLSPKWIYPDSIPDYKQPASKLFAENDSIREAQRADSLRAALRADSLVTIEATEPEAQASQGAQPAAKPAEAAKPTQPAAKAAQPATKAPETAPATDSKSTQPYNVQSHPGSDICLYYLVVGTMKSEASAQRLLETIRKDFPLAGMLSTGKHWIVYVDCSASREEAQVKLNQLYRDKRVKDPYVWSVSMINKNK